MWFSTVVNESLFKTTYLNIALRSQITLWEKEDRLLTVENWDSIYDRICG